MSEGDFTNSLSYGVKSGNLKSKVNKIVYTNLRRLLLVLFVVLLYSLYNYFDLGAVLTKENVEKFLSQFGPWVPPVFLAIFITAMICYIPASIFLITIGTLLGPIWGAFWGLIGCYLASLIVFYIGRRMGLGSIRQKMGEKWNFFNEKIEEDGFIYLVLVRASSLLPFAVIGYGSAVTSIKFSDYLKGTIIGCIPQIIIYCYILPMIISKNFAIENIISLAVITFVWLSIFGYAYFSHKKNKQKLFPSSVK